MTDDAGTAVAVNTYDEYGIPGSGNVGRFQYTGQMWLPELGFYYYKARMYSPTLGRFLQPDPIGYGDGLNLYGYVGGDPVNATDPSELAVEPGTWTCKNGQYDRQKRRCGHDAATPTGEREWIDEGEGILKCPDGYEADRFGLGQCASGSQALSGKLQKADCNTRLPNGKTVGDYVRNQRAALQSMADATVHPRAAPFLL